MKSSGILVGAATLLAVWPAASHAQSPHQAFDMVGPGTRTCGEFLSDIRQYKNAEDYYFYWTQGFMSGSNSELRIAGKARRDLNSPQMPMEAQQQTLKRFCQDNPSERYLFAVGGLFRNLPIMKDR
jgi:hypothetical protein